MSVNTEAVANPYAATDTGQPDGRTAVMAPDAVRRWPQSGEVVRGLDLRDRLIVEEIDYFGDPFDGPAWRADLVELEDLPRAATS